MFFLRVTVAGFFGLYVVDNSFTQDELGLRGPTDFFPKFVLLGPL